jgi:hypothetical protein
MSYSFAVRAATKAAAIAAVTEKFDLLIEQHFPIHKRDRAAVLANVEAAVAQLADDDTKDVTVSVNGYLSWSGVGDFTPDTAPVSAVGISCAAGLVFRAE